MGEVVRIASDGTPSTLSIVLQFVRNEGDAWTWILDHLTRALDALAPATPAEKRRARICSPIATRLSAAIGRRLGEMHAILARDTC